MSQSHPPTAIAEDAAPHGTAVVVGGGQGIGAAIARELARQPWCARLVVADRDGDAAGAVAAELGAEAHVVDITDAAAVARLVEATADAAHVAIPAGVFAASPPLETPREEFERLLAINCTGVYAVAQAYAREMVTRGDGAIVAVASVAARHPRMRQAAYSASKAGMRQALRVLGMDVAARGVRVNFVSPGPTDTPMMRQLAADHPSVDALASGSPEAFRPPIPDRRVARPDDIARATAYLLSPDSTHVLLHDLVIDGGELLGI